MKQLAKLYRQHYWTLMEGLRFYRILSPKEWSVGGRFSRDSGFTGSYLLKNGQLVDIFHTIQDVLVAGIDTSAAALEWTISELLLNPFSLKKTQEEIDEYADVNGGLVEESKLNEMKYLKAVIRESLRLHPPAPLLVPREAINTCKVADYEIAKGSRVLVNAWAISHSDDVWEEAETFKAERFLLPHNKNAGIDVLGHNNFDVLPFGSGRRRCPGSYMALQWMEYVVANLLHFFDLKLNNVGGLDMEEEFGLSVARATLLIVVPSIRGPSMGS